MCGKICGRASCKVLSRSKIQIRDLPANELLMSLRKALAIANQRSHALVGQHFQQQRVLDPPVNDVDTLYAALGRFQRRTDLGQHTPMDGAVREQGVHLFGRQAGQELAVLVEYSRRIGQQNQFFGAQNFGQFPGDEVGIDIVGLAILAHAYGRHYRNEFPALEQRYDLRVNALNLADLPDVEHFAALVFIVQKQLLGADEGTVLACQTDGTSAVLVDEIDDLLVDQPAQDHFDNVHGFTVGDPHALNELTLLADALEHVVDLRPAAMDDHRIHADQLEQYHVSREGVLQLFVAHGIAAVLDDDRLAVEAADIRQRFGKDLRFQRYVGGGKGHGALTWTGSADSTATVAPSGGRLA